VSRVAYARRNTPACKQLVRESVAALLAHESFDLIVSDSNFDGIDTLIRQSGAPRTVTNLWRKPPSDMRVGDRFLYILLEEGLISPLDIAAPELHLTLDEYNKALQRLGTFHNPLVLLFVDAGMPIKRWPLERFTGAGRALQDQYGAQVMVLSGTGKTAEDEASAVAASIGGEARALERMGLRELAAVINYADLYIGADTGPSHLAACMGVPTITLFGPSWHHRYGQPAPHVNLQGYPSCPQRIISDFTLQPCWYSHRCPLGLWQTCLEDISVEQVLTAAEPFIASNVQQVHYMKLAL
jgi:ADP-heptose:LPS heptosyltransferase